MSEFYPILTNDGSVGLFSIKDNDIYHSAYGALSESFEKFVLPADLASKIIENNEVKILDICYGIGYNTKTSIQTFLNLKKNNFKKNKKFSKNFSRKIFKKNFAPTFNIASIDTDNISEQKKWNFKKKFNKKFSNKKNPAEKISDSTNSIASIDADNIYVENLDFEKFSGEFEENKKSKKNSTDNEKKSKKHFNLFFNNQKSNLESKKLIIDAIDIDKELVYISPFIRCDLINHNKAKHINKALLNYLTSSDTNNNESSNTFLKLKNELTRKDYISSKTAKKYKLHKNTNKIIYNSLKKQNEDFISNEILKNNLSKKIFSSIFDKNIKKIHKLNEINRYKLKDEGNKSTFLHNIYYQYISMRDIFNRFLSFFTKNSVQNDIMLNFHFSDARNVIQNLDKKYDFIFLDAFSPNKCPILWSEDFFKLLNSKLKEDGVLLTYSSAAAVRNAMMHAGFFVGKIFNKDLNKFTGTIATKKNDLVIYSLDELEMALINSKSGITYKDHSLNSSIEEIISAREDEIKNSNLKSSTKAVKEVKNARQI
ncbi:MAG: MnmC family methyltransferase [bacterium]|nr:MnmC family methyltransferase [bacterium]